MLFVKCYNTFPLLEPITFISRCFAAGNVLTIFSFLKHRDLLLCVVCFSTFVRFSLNKRNTKVVKRGSDWNNFVEIFQTKTNLDKKNSINPFFYIRDIKKVGKIEKSQS